MIYKKKRQHLMLDIQKGKGGILWRAIREEMVTECLVGNIQIFCQVEYTREKCVH